MEVDPQRVQQVLSNLVDNALKYSSPDQPVDVRIQGDGTGRGVEVEVADRGIGLPPEALEQVFTAFGRASNVGMTPGLGMGLYVAREIVERHGGRIWAESAGPGQGTAMHVWLPASPSGA